MGLFSKDYESSGSGISKDDVKKKGLALFFDLLGRKFWSLMWVNVLYVLFFIPLMLIMPAIYFINNNYIAVAVICILVLIFAIVIGPATAGMMKIMRMFYIGKHTFIAHDFFEAVRDNFKRAAVVGLVDCFVIFSAFAALQVYPALAVQYTRALYIPMVITFSLFLMVFIMNFYVFLMLTSTTLTMKQILKNSFMFAISGMKQNLLTVGVIVAIMFIM